MVPAIRENHQLGLARQLFNSIGRRYKTDGDGDHNTTREKNDPLLYNTNQTIIALKKYDTTAASTLLLTALVYTKDGNINNWSKYYID